jgi:hypothetical protein
MMGLRLEAVFVLALSVFSFVLNTLLKSGEQYLYVSPY